MKANEFVKKFGWEDAKKVICLQDSPIYEVIWDIKNKKFKNDNGFATLLCETNDNFVFLPYLKRLVESHELVESYGGLEAIKDFIKENGYTYTEFGVQALKAIELVEKCNASD